MQPTASPQSVAQLPALERGVAIIKSMSLTFDPGDRLNGSLYLCAVEQQSAAATTERAIGILQRNGLWSDAPSRQVRDDQKDLYAAQLTFVEAVEVTVNGAVLTLARFDHPKFPSSAERFEQWKQALA